MNDTTLGKMFTRKSEDVLKEFSEASGTETLLGHLEDVEVYTKSFEAEVTASLSFTTETTQINSPKLEVTEADADRVLRTHFESIDESDQWLEHHLGLNENFERKKSCSCNYSETCATCRGEKIVTCNSCKGNKHVTCDHFGCQGGSVSCDRFDCHNGYFKCSACSGFGQVQETFRDPGSPSSVQRYVRCGSCSGTGRGYACFNCKGTSRISCPKCRGTNRIECKKCDATGILDCISCQKRGYNAFQKTLLTHVKTDRSYVGETSDFIDRLRSKSDAFRQQLIEAPKHDLSCASKGKSGRYTFSGVATYSYIKPADELLVFVGHLQHPAWVSQKLFEPVIRSFADMVSTLDLDELDKSSLGKEVVRCMCGEERTMDGHLYQYDRNGVILDSVAKTMPKIDKVITQGETALKLKLLALCGFAAFLVYLMPFQKALESMGFGELVSLLTPVSPWYWGSFIMLWGMPLLTVALYNLIRRKRRTERSTKILGASRKMKLKGKFTTWLGAMVVQTAVLAGTTFLPEPFFPKPCYEAESEQKFCVVISVVTPYIAAPINIISQLPGSNTYPMDSDISEPRLENLRPSLNAFRDNPG